jgi:hypothetical protein
MLELNANKFSAGKIFMTAGVNERIAEDEKFAKFVLHSIRRYLQCDWGDLGEEDKALNDAALNTEFPDRLFSAYEFNGKADRIYIITEWDRSCTTILFPSEY